MELEPTHEERAWVLAQLGALVQRRGPATLVRSLIVEQDPSHFPERITVSLQGADLIARRLLRYADLEALDVDVAAYDDRQRALAAACHGGSDHPTAALFTGIHDGCCCFAVALETFSDPASIPPALAHEVAHAYRAHHGLQVDEHGEEERLTDLTAIYLGFGVLVANASDYFRTSGGSVGTLAVTRWSTGSLGYLSMPTMCFALALQLFLRRDRGARKQARRRLSPNQAAAFDASTRWIEEHASEVLSALPLPELDTLPPARPLAELLRPLQNVPEWEPPPPPTVRNRDREVFRVRRHRGAANMILGGLLGSVPAALVVARSQTPLGLALMVAAIGGGWLYGRRVRADVCAERDCEALLPAGVTECPGCGGRVVGEIASADDRLEAEERLRHERARANRP